MFPDTSEAAVMAQLEPYLEQFRGIFDRAVTSFNKIPPDLLRPLMEWRRSRATCIWAYVMDEVRRTFPDASVVRLNAKYETIELHFGPNLVARMKKMSVAGFTSNYPTRRAKAFHDGMQGELFQLHWSKPLRVDIGYVLNQTATAVEQVGVSRRKTYKMLDWLYWIPGPQGAPAIPIGSRTAPQEPGARIEARHAGAKATTTESKANEQ